jgi:hypothetical protein
MAMKIVVNHKSKVSVALDYTQEYKSIAKAKNMAKYYREKGEHIKASEIDYAIQLQEKAIKLLDEVLSGNMTWEELNKQ